MKRTIMVLLLGSACAAVCTTVEARSVSYKAGNSYVSLSGGRARVSTPDGWKDFDGVDAAVTQPRYGLFGFRRGETTTLYRYDPVTDRFKAVKKIDNREGPLGLVGRTVESKPSNENGSGSNVSRPGQTMVSTTETTENPDGSVTRTTTTQTYSTSFWDTKL